MTERPAPRRGKARDKPILLAIIALAAVVALIAATQGWVVIALTEGAAAFTELQVTGQQLNPSLSPVAIAALAATLALTIAGRVFRRVLGVLVVLLGVGVTWLGMVALMNPRGEAEWSVGEATGIVGDAQQSLIVEISMTAWPIVAVVSGVVLGAAGVGVTLVSGRWRSGGRRYESSRAPRTETETLTASGRNAGATTTAAAAVDTADATEAVRAADAAGATGVAEATDQAGSAAPDRISDWDAISQGDDPTRAS